MTLIVLRRHERLDNVGLESSKQGGDSTQVAGAETDRSDSLQGELERMKMFRRLISSSQDPNLLNYLSTLDSVIGRQGDMLYGSASTTGELCDKSCPPITDREARDMGRVANTKTLALPDFTAVK